MTHRGKLQCIPTKSGLRFVPLHLLMLSLCHYDIRSVAELACILQHRATLL